MKLSVLFKRIQHAVIQMPELEEEMEIRGITCNSQKAEEDSLFVCIQGSRADGHDYIEEACNLGASCILIEKLVSGGRMLKFPENVAVVLVKDTGEKYGGSDDPGDAGKSWSKMRTDRYDRPPSWK